MHRCTREYVLCVLWLCVFAVSSVGYVLWVCVEENMQWVLMCTETDVFIYQRAMR